MIRLYDKGTGQYVGRITDDDLQFLIDHLEKEDPSDTDYYINRATLDLLKEEGMSEDFARLIENGMGGNDEIEIGYERE
ncbi:MAG: galactosyldiacylglycerol synthase [Candidatus Zixiibacteriota bacterium]